MAYAVNTVAFSRMLNQQRHQLKLAQAHSYKCLRIEASCFEEASALQLCYELHRMNTDFQSPC